MCDPPRKKASANVSIQTQSLISLSFDSHHTSCLCHIMFINILEFVYSFFPGPGPARCFDPRPGCDTERDLREIDDAVKCILQQLLEVPLRLTSHTLDVLIWQPIRFKADPAEDAFRKAVILTHRDDRIHHLPLHETEVPRTVHDVGIRDAIDQLIKSPGKPRADRRLSLPIHPARRYAVIIPGLQHLHHLRKQRRRVLHIRIHHSDIITTRIAEARVHRRFLSEDPRIFPGPSPNVKPNFLSL